MLFYSIIFFLIFLLFTFYNANFFKVPDFTFNFLFYKVNKSLNKLKCCLLHVFEFQRVGAEKQVCLESYQKSTVYIYFIVHSRHVAWYVSANLQKRILMSEKTCFYFSSKRLCFLSF